MRVNLRGPHIRMSQQRLDGPQVRSSFQQMRRKRMPERVGRRPLVDHSRKQPPAEFQAVRYWKAGAILIFQESEEKSANASSPTFHPISLPLKNIRAYLADANR